MAECDVLESPGKKSEMKSLVQNLGLVVVGSQKMIFQDGAGGHSHNHSHDHGHDDRPRPAYRLNTIFKRPSLKHPLQA